MYTNFFYLFIDRLNSLGSKHSEHNACISYMLATQIQGQILNYFLRQNSQIDD